MRDFLVGLAVLASLAACDSSTAGSGGRLFALELHQTQWEHRSFHSYSFDYQRFGLGGANAHVIVTNDVVTSVSDSTTGGAPGIPANYPTVDSVFAAARSFFGDRNVRVDAEYDAQLGYPTHVSAYTVPSNPGGGYQVSVSNFQPIE